jgi:hypothetical protein
MKQVRVGGLRSLVNEATRKKEWKHVARKAKQKPGDSKNRWI